MILLPKSSDRHLCHRLLHLAVIYCQTGNAINNIRHNGLPLTVKLVPCLCNQQSWWWFPPHLSFLTAFFNLKYISKQKVLIYLAVHLWKWESPVRTIFLPVTQWNPLIVRDAGHYVGQNIPSLSCVKTSKTVCRKYNCSEQVNITVSKCLHCHASGYCCLLSQTLPLVNRLRGPFEVSRLMECMSACWTTTLAFHQHRRRLTAPSRSSLSVPLSLSLSVLCCTVPVGDFFPAAVETAVQWMGRQSWWILKQHCVFSNELAIFLQCLKETNWFTSYLTCHTFQSSFHAGVSV